MCFKQEIPLHSAGCVFAPGKQVESMEVWQVWRIAGYCAALMLTMSLHAQLPSANVSANTNAVTRSTFATNQLLDDQHRLRSGDKLSFRVMEDGEDAKTLPVTDSGEVELPNGFGRFTAAGKTCRVLAQEIKAELEKDYYKRATVQLGLDSINNIRGQAYVSGQVSKPGPVNIPVNALLKLSQAILIVGPPTQWAKLSAVKVVRQTGKDTRTMIVDVDAILNKGRPENDMMLEPDDLVIVPERGVLIGN